MDLLSIKPHVITEGLLGKKVLVYGQPGTWKTTFASSFSKPLFAATEIGYTFIPGIKAVDISSWYMFTDLVEQLKKPEVRAEYDTIVIDTVKLLADMCIKYICNKNSVSALSDIPWGGGWNQYKDALSSTFNLIAQLGYGIVFISHSKDKTDEDSEQLVASSPNTDRQTSDIMYSLSDFVFYVRKEESEDGKIAVWSYNNTPGAIMSKARLTLPPRIKFTFKEVDDAITKEINNLGLETSEKVVVVEQEKPSLEDLVESIKKYGTVLIERGLQDFVTNSISSLNIPLPDVTMINYDQLEAINHSFKEKLSPIG